MYNLGPLNPMFTIPPPLAPGMMHAGALPMPMPMPIYGGGGAMPMPSDPAMWGMPGDPGAPPERFVNSAAGGVILDKDGAPTGRVPAGSFVDTKDGKLYGPDGKALAVPAGSTVDFFDLPDVAQLVSVFAGGGSAAPGKGPGAMPPAVLGQWGPGGTTPIKPGAHGAAGCDMDHGGHGKPTYALGGGPSGMAHHLTSQLQQLLAGMGGSPTGPGGMPGPGVHAAYGPMMPPGMYPPGMQVGFNPAVHGGGLGTGVLGANGLGATPSLQSALMELIATLDQLAKAVQATTSGGGAPAAPAKVEPVKAEPVPAMSSTPTTTEATTATTTEATAVAGAAGGGSSSTTDSSTSTDTATSTDAPQKAT